MITVDIGDVRGPDAFTVWCGRQSPALDPNDPASYDAWLAALKGDKGETGEKGAAGLTEGQVDARIAAANLQAALTFDTEPTDSSSNPVTSGGVKAALDDKQDALTFDAEPTDDSPNPVTSGGVKAAIDAAGIGDTGWISLTLAADNRILAGNVDYRVKNGMLWINGAVQLANHETHSLTQEAIPQEYLPPVRHQVQGVFLRASAGSSRGGSNIWLLPHVSLNLSTGLINKGGVINHRTAGGVLSGAFWLMIQSQPLII